MTMYTAQEIRALRKRLGLRITAFAYELGVSASTVISWEADRRHPKYEHMRKLNDIAERKSNGHARPARKTVGAGK
jgi:DNA-binding transcriptional regulator YiaG